ncbi:unnamed protein product [Cochlearia groenlandica]
MRFPSRPVSSPGRPDNPPLLMRFLRTNIGSRSRGRSRSKKPIFFRRRNTTATTTETHEEPTSPKVTCMGQIRINRSKKPKPETGRRVFAGRERRCGFFRRPFAGKACFSPVWRKWKTFSHVSFSRKSEKMSNSSRSEPIFGRSTVKPEEIQRKQIREEEEEEEEEEKEESLIVTTPPRNALFLTRCRSAPYSRSPSSLDHNSLWEEIRDIKEAPFRRFDDDDVISSPEKLLGSKDSTVRVTETEDKGRESTASEESKRCVLRSGRELTAKSPRGQCLVLTRCNSEPSRVGEKLVPEIGYRLNRRLGFT